MSTLRRSAGIYTVYGLRVRSAVHLATRPVADTAARVDAEILVRSASFFHDIYRSIGGVSNEPGVFQHRLLSDGARYLRWPGLFECLVSSDGATIDCRRLARSAAADVFGTDLLSHVLSFVLLRLGLEHLHSTSVIVNDHAIGFLGDCGYGKSTLAAAFVRAGRRLLTDDVMVVKETPGGFMAYPGPARIKLFPETAQAMFGHDAGRASVKALTNKRVIPLDHPASSSPAPAPLRALYVLPPSSRRVRSETVTIERLSPRRAFVELTRNTFNALVVDPPRLARQFHLAAQLSITVPVKAVTFPRGLERIDAVREAIEADLVA